MTADRPSEDAELVLQTHDVHVADIEEVRGAQIGRQILLLDLEANHFRVLVATLDIVHRNGKALALRMRACDGCQQVGRERGNATLTRQVVANKRDLADSGSFLRSISIQGIHS